MRTAARREPMVPTKRGTTTKRKPRLRRGRSVRGALAYLVTVVAMRRMPRTYLCRNHEVVQKAVPAGGSSSPAHRPRSCRTRTESVNSPPIPHPLPSLVPRHHSAPQYIPLGACAATRPPRSRVATYVTPSAPHPFTAHAGVRLPSWRGQLALYSCLEYVDKSSHGRLEHVDMGAWSMLKSRPIVALPQPWRRHIWASSRACVASSHMS